MGLYRVAGIGRGWKVGKPLELLDIIAGAGVPHTRQVYDTSAGLSRPSTTLQAFQSFQIAANAHAAHATPTSHAEGSTEGTSLPRADQIDL